MTDEKYIHDYVTLVTDREQLIDSTRVQGLKEDLEVATDPVERIKLRSLIEREQSIPVDEITKNFVNTVKGWVEDNGVTVGALLEEGVSAEILQEAGIELNGHAPQAKKATKKRTRKAKAEQPVEEPVEEPTTEVVKVSTDDVTKHVRRTRKPFTIPQIMEATSASRATVKKAIDELIEEGAVEETGEERSSGRGRAAAVFARVS